VIFQTSKRKITSYYFIDEIDAVGRQEENNMSGGNDEVKIR
jgi:ATP-dependent Zn protease